VDWTENEKAAEPARPEGPGPGIPEAPGPDSAQVGDVTVVTGGENAAGVAPVTQEPPPEQVPVQPFPPAPEGTAVATAAAPGQVTTPPPPAPIASPTGEVEAHRIEASDLAVAPGFLLGAEVARSARLQQPAADEQLSLLNQEAAFRKKLYLALIVIAAVFFAGMIAGAVVGVFV